MKIMVTGASGGFGRAALAALLETVPASDLVAMTRSPDKLADVDALGVSVRLGDFDDRDSMVRAFAGVERLLLISGTLVGQRISQHRNAIEAARTAGVEHVVYTSIVGTGMQSLALGDHRATEEMLAASGLGWTALRNSQYIDAFVEAIAPLALSRGVWTASAADGRIAPVLREDCVAAAVAALLHPPTDRQILDITGPELLSYRDAAALIADMTGIPIEYRVVDDAGMYAFFDGLGIPRAPIDQHVVAGVPWCSDDMVSFERAIRHGEMAVLSDDVAMLTGRAPRSLASVVRERLPSLIASSGKMVL